MRIQTIVGALLVGSILGVWACWVQERDDHLFKMYDCAHARTSDSVSLEEAWISCEKDNR